MNFVTKTQHTQNIPCDSGETENLAILLQNQERQQEISAAAIEKRMLHVLQVAVTGNSGVIRYMIRVICTEASNPEKMLSLLTAVAADHQNFDALKELQKLRLSGDHEQFRKLALRVSAFEDMLQVDATTLELLQKIIQTLLQETSSRLLVRFPEQFPYHGATEALHTCIKIWLLYDLKIQQTMIEIAQIAEQQKRASVELLELFHIIPEFEKFLLSQRVLRI